MKIALDAGHGIFTSGKRCDVRVDPSQTSEWFLNQRIASKVEKMLAEYKGVETLRLDDITGKTDVLLNTRTNKANKWGADWCFSFHHNAGINGGKGGGIVVFTYTTSNAAEKAMQRAIYNSCMAHGGLSGRAEPMNSANFHMVREPKGNAILTEYGFMDSTTDTPIILTEDFAERMAIATVEAIVSQLNLEKKGDDSPMTTAEKKEFEALKMKLEKLEAKIEDIKPEKVYHYYSELPGWARPIIEPMHINGVFKGAGPDDMNLPESLMRVLVILASAGVLKA